jgi:hypothetical protein
MNSILRFIALFTLLLVAEAMAQQGPKHPRFKAGEIICKVAPGCNIEQINASYGTSTQSQQPTTGYFLLIVPQGADAESLSVVMAGDPCVARCMANYFLSAPEGLQRSSPFTDQQATADIDSQVSVRRLGLRAAQAVSTGVGIRVAVIDGGVNLTHPFFADKPGELVSRYDYIDGDSVATEEPIGSCSGHGTFVAGITRLVAPGADILIYRVLDSMGQGDGYTIASAVLQAVADSCRIINLSLGMTGIHDALDDALKLAHQHDILIVAAAGNDSTDVGILFPFPASRDYCVAVAALDSFDLKASFSNYGTKIAVSAPGTWIYAPYLDTIYAWWDGTSFAAPFVSGLAALLRAEHPAWFIDQVDSAIQASAQSIDSLNPLYVGLLGRGVICPPLAVLGSGQFRGDLTSDGNVDIADLTALINFLYIDLTAPYPGVLGDIDCDGQVDISDVTRLIAYLYLGGPPSCTG